MITIHLENVIKSFGIERCVQALQEYAPTGDFQFTDHIQAADVVVYQVNGRLEHTKRKIAHHKKPYVLVQHAWKSTKNPTFEEWEDVWKGAVMVWSHYDLPISNLYRSPLGVSKDFTYRKKPHKYIICTSGLSYLTESVRECIKAAEAVGGRVLHLGPSHAARKHSHVDCVTGVTDKELSKLYNQCTFVSGLRRIEGFELPCAEGIICGAKPIFFDQPHYKDWFGDMAEYITEGPRPLVEKELTDLFQKECVVTPKDRKTAKKLFDWNEIIPSFYDNFFLHYEHSTKGA